MIISCKCLNVSLDLGKIKPKGISLTSLKLSSTEEANKFFAEGVAEIDTLVSICKNVPSLTTLDSIGSWIIESCMNCNLSYFAKSTGIHNVSLISAGLIADPNTMLMLRSRPEYSPVFRIVIREPFFKGTNFLEPAMVREALSGLQQQLAQAVKKEAEKIDDKIRSFTDQQHELLATFRDRATHDHDAIVKLLRQAEAATCKSVEDKPNVTTPTSPSSSSPTNFSTPKSRMPTRHLAIRSQSLCPSSATHDTEGIFTFDEIEDSLEHVASDAESDTDHDDSSSHDEGIEIHRKKVNPTCLAKSLPVNVPAFSISGFKLQPMEFPDDDYRPQEPVPTDIAASIKALARSVHSDVFGDLPRPRFSTQI